MHHAASMILRLCSLGLRVSPRTPPSFHGVALVTSAAPNLTTCLKQSQLFPSISTRQKSLFTKERRASATADCTPLGLPQLFLTSKTLTSGCQPKILRCYRPTACQHNGALPKFGSLTEHEYQEHPNKFRDLSVTSLRKIFGPAIKENVGNDLLRTIQKQRITGTIDQEIDKPYATPKLVTQGLRWLRANYPLDEEAAIVKRIEEENRQMEEEFIADIDKYKNYTPQQGAAEEGLYGKSQFEELRKAKQAKAAAREKQAEEIREAHGTTDMVSNAKGHTVLAGQKTESAEWVKRYKERAALSKALEPPKMSLTKRLLPSALFAAAFLILCILFAANYTPPIKEARLFPDSPPAATTVIALISMNVTFFMMWRLPIFWRLMNRNFLLVAATPYPPSLLGNTFSHQGVAHLVTNMIFLWIVGTRLHDKIGRGNFLAIYLAGGVFASWASLVRLVLSNHLMTCTLGASGAVTALLAAWLCLMSPSGNKVTFVWFGQDVEVDWAPLCARIALGLVIFVEFAGFLRGIKHVDYFSHLGGYAVGIFSAGVLTWKLENQRIPPISPRTNILQDAPSLEKDTKGWRASRPVEKEGFTPRA